MYRLLKKERLRGEKTAKALFEDGKSGFSHPLKYVYSIAGPSDKGDCGVSILVSVPKRNHKRAFRRNLLKRRIREAYRTNKEPLAGSAAGKDKKVEIAFIYATKEIEDFKTIENAVRKIIARIESAL